MNKLIGAAAALVLVGALVAAGCESAADDDCDDAIGVVHQDQGGPLAVELVAAPAGKGGGGKSSGRKSAKKPRGNSTKSPGRHGTSRHRTSHGHHDDDWFDCD
jgi:hypothetical protein